MFTAHEYAQAALTTGMVYGLALVSGLAQATVRTIHHRRLRKALRATVADMRAQMEAAGLVPMTDGEGEIGWHRQQAARAAGLMPPMGWRDQHDAHRDTV